MDALIVTKFCKIFTGKNCALLNSVQEFIKIEALAAANLFHMFTQSIKFCTFHCHILIGAYVWKRWLIRYNLVFLFNVGPGFFLCNVGEIFAMLKRHLQQQVIIKKINQSKIKIAQKSNVAQTALGFRYNVVWSLLGSTAQGFYLCNVVPRVLGQHWTWFLLSNVVWSLLYNVA